MERRRAHRVPFNSEVRYAATNPTPQEGSKAVTRDVSRSGLALVTDRSIPPKTAIGVELTLPGWERPIRVNGEIIWQRNIESSIAPAFITGIHILLPFKTRGG